MRMWMINPKLLCLKHLLGEHGEIHKFRHTFVKQHSIKGRMEPVVQIEPGSMEARHDELATELLRRKKNHKSPYTQPDLFHLPAEYMFAKVDKEVAVRDLCMRCADCRKRIVESNEYGLTIFYKEDGVTPRDINVVTYNNPFQGLDLSNSLDRYGHSILTHTYRFTSSSTSGNDLNFHS